MILNMGSNKPSFKGSLDLWVSGEARPGYLTIPKDDIALAVPVDPLELKSIRRK